MWMLLPRRRIRSILIVLLACCCCCFCDGTTSQQNIVQGFRLLDTTDASTLRTIEDGAMIDPLVDGSHLTIVVDVLTTTSDEDTTSPPVIIDHVTFSLNDNPSYRIESRAPYTLGGDQNGGRRYHAEPALQQSGVYTLGVAVYSADLDDGDDPVVQTSITLTVLHDAPGVDTTTAENNETVDHPNDTQNDDNKKPAPAPAAIVDDDDEEKKMFDAPKVTTAPPIASPSSTDVPAYRHSPTGAWTGEARQWHKLTLGWDGPPDLSESTSAAYQLDVTFRHYSSDTTLVIPGYYAADGNAANTGATEGPVWLVHLAPPLAGIWQWECSFRQNGSGASAGYMDGTQGSVRIAAAAVDGDDDDDDDSDSRLDSRDHRRKGRLEYVPGHHHLQFAGTKDFYLKVGADSPENFLAYDGFDNTPNRGGRRKDWGPHVRDFREGTDPTWAGGKGKGIIGALNYLALEKGMNSFSFLTMNIGMHDKYKQTDGIVFLTCSFAFTGGDDKNVFPYVSDQSKDYMRMGRCNKYDTRCR